MSGGTSPINDFIPQKGVLHQDDALYYILCKPKLMPLKSLTLEKLEKMKREAEQKLKGSAEVLQRENESANDEMK